MRVLFDHGTPKPLRSFLEGHTVQRTQDMGWDTLTNGELLVAAEEAGFDLLITTDKNIRHQQDLSVRRIALVVLGTPRWPVVRLHVERISATVDAAKPGSYTEVDIDVV